MAAAGVTGSISGTMSVTEADDVISASGVVGEVQNFPAEPFFARSVINVRLARIGSETARLNKGPFQ
jgi:hypothetical protein